MENFKYDMIHMYQRFLFVEPEKKFNGFLDLKIKDKTMIQQKKVFIYTNQIETK
jgi:hypothetical protein